METRTLGGGLTVSAVGLGCMGFSHAYGAPMERGEAVRRIRETAQQAVQAGIERPERFAIVLPHHFDVEVEFVKHNRARRASFYPGVKQTGPRSVRFSSDAYYDVLRFFLFCL